MTTEVKSAMSLNWNYTYIDAMDHEVNRVRVLMDRLEDRINPLSGHYHDLEAIIADLENQIKTEKQFLLDHGKEYYDEGS